MEPDSPRSIVPSLIEPVEYTVIARKGAILRLKADKSSEAVGELSYATKVCSPLSTGARSRT